MAPSTHANRNSGTSSMRWATLAGVRKMPLPIVEPTSTATALHRPSRRINRSPQRSAGIKGADMETQYTRERNEDQRTRFGFDPRPKRARSARSAPLQGAPSSSPTNPRWPIPDAADLDPARTQSRAVNRARRGTESHIQPPIGAVPAAYTRLDWQYGRSRLLVPGLVEAGPAAARAR